MTLTWKRNVLAREFFFFRKLISCPACSRLCVDERSGFVLRAIFFCSLSLPFDSPAAAQVSRDFQTKKRDSKSRTVQLVKKREVKMSSRPCSSKRKRNFLCIALCKHFRGESSKGSRQKTGITPFFFFFFLILYMQKKKERKKTLLPPRLYAGVICMFRRSNHSLFGTRTFSTRQQNSRVLTHILPSPLNRNREASEMWKCWEPDDPNRHT